MRIHFSLKNHLLPHCMLYTLTFYSFFVVASFGRLCVVVNETNEAKRLDNLCKCAWRQCCWRSAVSDDVLIVYWMKLLIVQCPALKTIILSFDARRLHQKKRWKKISVINELWSIVNTFFSVRHRHNSYYGSIHYVYGQFARFDANITYFFPHSL